MSIKSDYKKARTNYLSRVRRLESMGYYVDRIAIPKTPTQASINRLQKQSTKSIKAKSPLYDILTGEILAPHTTSTRKKIETRNKKNTEFVKSVNKEITSDLNTPNTPKSKQKPIKITRGEPVEIGGTQALFSDDIAIKNFYDSIETFIPPLQPFLKQRMDELLGDNSPERRKMVAQTIRENPDYLPAPSDSRESTISYKFSELERMLNLNLEQSQILQELAGANGVTP